ncbi:hypothetical protein NXH76_21600 [Blautia schinkii]|nr:hypothetical protein [Blautia schinkii]
MEEDMRFEEDVGVVARALELRALREERASEARKLFSKFKETGQEPVRLAVALRGFFLEEGVEDSERGEYGRYLKQRIRPAVEHLIEQDDVEKIEKLEQMGWFHERELESFICRAREHNRPAVLMWLMHLKNEKYGFRDRDFTL